MKTSWQAESGGLTCRWSDILEGDTSDSPTTLQSSTGTTGTFVPPMPDFAAHSPLGSGEWFVPWAARWSVQRSLSV